VLPSEVQGDTLDYELWNYGIMKKPQNDRDGCQGGLCSLAFGWDSSCEINRLVLIGASGGVGWSCRWYVSDSQENS
jgi:hypothetical protein